MYWFLYGCKKFCSQYLSFFLGGGGQLVFTL